MKVVHLGIDSHFVDHLAASFERHLPGGNKLVQIAHEKPRERGFDGPRSWYPATAENLATVVEEVADGDVVVVHAMTDFAALVCARLPEDRIIVWSGFGFDYYTGDAGADLYGEATTNLMRRAHAGAAPDPWGRLTKVGQPRTLDALAMDEVRQAVARRVDYFSAPGACDLDVLRRAYPGFAGTYQQLHYGDLDSMASGGSAVASGRDVLVGNSAGPTNNHVETFRKLAKVDLDGRRVVVPLTYGDPEYRDLVIAAGERILGEAFEPLVDHLPIGEYLEVVQRCSSAVFLHRRQQALGNIVAALHQGSHLYLDRRNPLYRWLSDLGLEIRPAVQLADGLPDGPLDGERLAAQRAALATFWGTASAEDNLARFVAQLERRVSASGRRERLRRVLPGARHR